MCSFSYGRLLVAVIAVQACGREVPATSATAARDSAGVAIVESTLDTARLAVWQIPDSPVVDIGGDEDGPAALQQVRAVLWDRDGTILIGDGATREARRFDSTGRHLATWGRNGDGPGEFRSISRMWPVPPDSIGIYDNVLRRVTVMSRTGEPGAVTSLRTLSYTYTVQPLGGSRMLLGFIPVDSSRATSGPTTRSRLTVTLTERDSIHLDTILTLPALETYPLLGREGDATFPAQSMPLFGKATILRADGSRILAATNDAFEIAEYDAEGTLQRLIRLLLPRRAVSDADRAEYVAQELRAIDEQNAGAPEVFREQWRTALREQRVSTHFPFIDDLLVAEDGALWVEVFRWRRGDPRRYFVFDEAGRLTARAAMPPRSRPMAIRGDRILALWRDADDIEHVRIYRVRR